MIIFKRINDHYGHQAGDEILKLVTVNLVETLRKIDIVSRYGGDEIIVLLPETDLERARTVADRLREAISASKLKLPQGIVRITASLGIASMGMCSPDLHHMVQCADQALYEAKKAGRDQVRFYDPDKKLKG